MQCYNSLSTSVLTRTKVNRWLPTFSLLPNTLGLALILEFTVFLANYFTLFVSVIKHRLAEERSSPQYLITLLMKTAKYISSEMHPLMEKIIILSQCLAINFLRWMCVTGPGLKVLVPLQRLH